MPSSRDTFKRETHRRAEMSHQARNLRRRWEIVFRTGEVKRPCQGHNGTCWAPAEPGQLCLNCQAIAANAAAQQQQKDAEG